MLSSSSTEPPSEHSREEDQSRDEIMRRAAAHVFVDDLSALPLALSGSDVHHLSRVLRLRLGERVSVSDGQGTVQVCEWAGGPALEPVGPPVRHRRPAPPVTVGFALTKGDHPERAVQKLTEVGADRVIVVMAARCVARWPATKQGHQIERLREVARQAAMQSRRAWLPVVDGPVPFLDLVAELRRLEPADLGRLGPADLGPLKPTDLGRAGPVAGERAAGSAPVALAVTGGGPVSLSTPTVLVGPEGGWTDEELAAVPHHVGLGAHVMRAETAAVAAGVLLAALRARLVAETA
ncbi:MAG: RsmE family RNA methyltransferase [Acidimicrobiales bacterium]